MKEKGEKERINKGEIARPANAVRATEEQYYIINLSGVSGGSLPLTPCWG
jgi:hypothetical protein